jgi:hypothetical protein
MAGLSELVQKSRLPAQVVGEPVVFDVLFTDQPVVDYRSVQKADGALAVASAPGRPAPDNGRLCQGAGGHDGGERRRSVLMLTTLLHWC